MMVKDDEDYETIANIRGSSWATTISDLISFLDGVNIKNGRIDVPNTMFKESKSSDEELQKLDEDVTGVAKTTTTDQNLLRHRYIESYPLSKWIGTAYACYMCRTNALKAFTRTATKYAVMLFILVFYATLSITEGCSSRSTPKPRPAGPTPRPNITFHTYACPPEYATVYCLNGATCFTVKIGEHLLYNCECAEGFMGPRCEFKDLDSSYLLSQKHLLLETASIAFGATLAIFLVMIVCIFLYIRYHRTQKQINTKIYMY